MLDMIVPLACIRQAMLVGHTMSSGAVAEHVMR